MMICWTTNETEMDLSNLYLEEVDEIDGEDGPHPVVRKSLTGLHPNDEEDSPAKWGQSCRINLLGVSK